MTLKMTPNQLAPSSRQFLRLDWTLRATRLLSTTVGTGLLWRVLDRNYGCQQSSRRHPSVIGAFPAQGQDDGTHTGQVNKLPLLKKASYPTAVNDSYTSSKDIACGILSRDILVTRIAAFREVQSLAFPSGTYSSFVLPLPYTTVQMQSTNEGSFFTRCNVA